jgi:UDP-N-acetyl-D-glucosamine dehydrogenase
VRDHVIEKIKNKEAIICIVGLGYVGLPLMLRFAQSGFRVIGIDVDEEKNRQLNTGQSYIQHILSDQITQVQHLIVATSNFALSAEADAIILCVPTPLNKYREPDLSYVLNTVDALIPYMRAGQLISLESTTYPGTTIEELKPRIESTGFVVGQSIFLVFSPEREDPGNPNFTTATIPKVCGGDTSSCQEVGVALYSAVIDHVVRVSSTKVAEMTKLLENIHRSVNIGLVNEMKILADKMGIDIYEVIDAAATKPFGFVPYYPGPGIGGHCIPIDPFYLTWKAREYGIHTRFIELAGEMNDSMPHWVVDKVAMALNQKERAIKNSKILILGLAYKRNIEDIRESPSIEIMELLQAQGAHIEYSDPHVHKFPAMRKHYFELTSVSLSPDSLAAYDCVILATAHQAFDYQMISEHAQLIVDTRGAFRAFKQDNIVNA